MVVLVRTAETVVLARRVLPVASGLKVALVRQDSQEELEPRVSR